MIDKAFVPVTVTVEIHFERDHINCMHCPMLETYSRNQCRRTGEYVLDTRARGYYCPLKIEEGEA